MNLRRRLAPEVIGIAECPLFHRWTLWDRWGFKVLIHHFMPRMADPDIHDHPRPFVTFVLRGGYLDTSRHGEREVMNAPKVRYRPAAWAHNTTTGRRGAWTLVIMGPVTRRWGFWRHGVWFGFKEYEQIFGFKRVCE